MLNENLLTSKDIEIYKLKSQIEKFKEYDNRRKEYYQNALIELGQLKDTIQEFEESKEFKKFKNLKTEINRLLLIVKHNKLEDTHDSNTLIRYSIELKNRELQNQVSKLTKENSKLRKDNNDLVNRICSLTNKLEKYGKI